ncbi:ATP-grasp domain-containing protein [Micromonospora sp. WMMD882]|uniref:ATP-grasp domain-containing protein n=1 Tax=Micromonospora sp. WMMD882 TaxID=3015151 RepID=UPI00248C6F08|nr:ATP-grasp domain-containing protein [Micromonospora sp. WMMD882]WBB77731.1 ATP-grasp domain-containing protein [Micromonospora sp. WMMD882]
MSTISPARTMRVALVDAHATGHQLLPALHRHGVECVHVRSPQPDIHQIKSPFPEGFVDDIRHEGDVAATAALLREQGVSRVLPGTESGVLLADQLSAELGTPGNGMTRPASRRDKHEMVVALRDAGLAHAASLLSSDAEEIVEWAGANTGYPVVLKPVASSARDHVVVCTSPEQVRAVHRKIMSSTDREGKTNSAVLAQQFLAGDEYFVNAVSRDGRHHTVEIWRYHKRRVAGEHTIHDYTEPLPPDDPRAATLEAYAHRVLDVLEIRNSASHAEIILTARGPVLVECAARTGGGVIPKILAQALAANQVDLLALSVAEPDEFDRLPTSVYRLLRHIRFVNLINLDEHGVAPSDEAMAGIRALPSYAHAVLFHPAGRPLARTVDFATQPGYVFLISDDAEQLHADYEKLREIERDLYVDASGN